MAKSKLGSGNHRKADVKADKVVEAKASKELDPIERLCESMNKALLAKYADIRAKLTNTDRHEINSRYEIAVMFKDVRDGDGKDRKYGDHAVDKVTNALGLGKTTVHDYANVARAWPNWPLILDLTLKYDRFAKPLTWSHLVSLAAVSDPAQRDQLLKETLDNGWTIRELKEKLRTGPTKGDEAISTADPQREIPRSFSASSKKYFARLDALGSTAVAFGGQFIEELDKTDPSELTDAFMDRLWESYRGVDGEIEQLGKCIERTDQRRRNFAHPRKERRRPGS